jgi:hypothetical protein
MRIVLIILLFIILIGCTQKIKNIGKAIEVKNQTEILKPLDISDDPKKMEILDFIKKFIITIKFQDRGGYPVKVDETSFYFVGFVIQGDSYLTVTQFTIRSMKGPQNKQYTIKLKDLGDHKYGFLSVRQDK